MSKRGRSLTTPQAPKKASKKAARGQTKAPRAAAAKVPASTQTTLAESFVGAKTSASSEGSSAHSTTTTSSAAASANSNSAAVFESAAPIAMESAKAPEAAIPAASEPKQAAAKAARTTFPSLTLGQVRIDAVTQAQALAFIAELVDSGTGGRVFTPNIDHVVMAESDARFRAAYMRATLSLADGFPIVATSKLTQVRLPQKVSGSDLVEPLMAQAAARGDRVFFYGGLDGVAEQARDKLLARHPGLQIVGCCAPRVPLNPNADELRDLLAPVLAAKPDLVLVALGAPKQELFIDLVADTLAPAVLLGIGASLDFIAGRVQRAPSWMADNGLEWLYRLNQERGRLWRRYLRDTQYPWIVAKHALKSRLNRRGSSP